MPTAMMQLIVIYYAHWTMDGDIYYALSTVDEIWGKNWKPTGFFGLSSD
jgi:hypothetical protein